MGDNNENQNTVSNSNGSNKKLVILGIVAGTVIVAMAAVIAILVLNGNKTEPATAPVETTSPETNKRDVVVTEDNVEEVIEQMEQEEYVPPGYYTVTQNYEWHFPTGDTESTDAHVENVSENTNDVYFDLFLESDTNQENPLYQSPVIPLGAVLEDFKLDTKLEAGTYDCIMVYHLVDENQNTISTVSMTVTVIVEG